MTPGRGAHHHSPREPGVANVANDAAKIAEHSMYHKLTEKLWKRQD